MLWRLVGILFFSGVWISTYAGDSPSFAKMKSVLDDRYPDYEILEPKERLVEMTEAHESFVQGILVGDFNSDGNTDFATKLRRPVREADQERFTDFELTHGDRGVRKAVVCNGKFNDKYACSTLVGPNVGFIRGTFEFREWEASESTLSQTNFKEGSREGCLDVLTSRKGKKTLTLETLNAAKYGAFFYPLDNHKYGACRFSYYH